MPAFWAYGWQEDAEEMRYLANLLLSRGVNHFTPHAFTLKPFPDPDSPPHFGDFNPLMPALTRLHGHMARAGSLLDGGEMVARAGALYYAEAEWAEGKSCMKTQDIVRALSLHGRDCDFVGEVRRNPAVFALVGGSDGAHQAIARLCDAGLGTCTVHVGQRLGYDDERIVSGTAQELLNESFDSLSVVLVENDHSDAFVVTHGLPDEAFDRDETPMTKSEVRSISLSKLQLTRGSVVYDVGSGSGSVSVECALQATQGRVYAIEMKEKALSLSRHNAEKFGLTNLELVAGAAPDALESLPAPTHAFIGGSTGKLRNIIDCLLAKNPDVRIVATAVTLETVAELTELSKSFEICDIAEVSVSKPRVLGRYRLMTAQNPVYIFTMQHENKN